MNPLATLLALLAMLTACHAHVMITYPGWRGDNFHKNGTPGVDDYSDTLWPYGMQWMYPCGGLKRTTNRTYWPTNGGAVALEPGWLKGHLNGLIYINLGHGTVPVNYSHPMVKALGIHGPTDEAYPGIPICLPQVSPPADLPPFKEGDNATIQVVLAAQHGAALYSCVDITFTENMDLVKKVNDTNCYNDSRIGIYQTFTTESLTGSTLRAMARPGWAMVAAIVATGVFWINS